ncbi:MAG TPA: hypothetical protein VFD43_03760 [Planctomycetota bacterium]|nr:hypothetical protein [Planctomycetota bacterium]
MSLDPPPRPRLRPAARGERGVSIVLAMLVLFVLLVVIFEIRYSASVEQDQARLMVESRRMGLLADAGVRQAESALLMDVEQAGEDAGTGDPGGGGDGGMGMFGDGGGGDDGGSGGDGEDGGESEPDVSETTSTTDSRLDEWNDPLALAPPFGEGYEVLVEVEDEDGKINLLGLWTADEALADAQREIVIALLDKAFEGTTLDLSFSDAMQLTDRLDDWARGNRGAFDPIPKPPLKASNAEDKAQEDGLDESILLVDEKHRPLTMGELALIEGLKAEHLQGFVENDVFRSGLDRYLTVWSQLELKPAPPEADPFADSPFTKFTQGSLFDQTLGQSPEGEQQEDPAEIVPEPTNDGLVNVNTASMPVLRALAPMDVPSSFLEKLGEFRVKIDELKKEAGLDAGESMFSQDVLATPGEEESGQDEQDDEDEDPTKYVFSTPDEVIEKVEQEFGLTLALDPEVQSTFLSRLAVTSHVFTIKVLVYTLIDDEATGEKRFGRRASYRKVVWRMVTADGARMLTLLPLEPYFDGRRPKDYGLDLEEFGEDYEERMRERESQLGAGF